MNKRATALILTMGMAALTVYGASPTLVERLILTGNGDAQGHTISNLSGYATSGDVASVRDQTSNETIRAKASESNLAVQVSNETTRAMASELASRTQTSNETTRAMAVETGKVGIADATYTATVAKAASAVQGSVVRPTDSTYTATVAKAASALQAIPTLAQVTTAGGWTADSLPVIPRWTMPTQYHYASYPLAFVGGTNVTSPNYTSWLLSEYCQPYWARGVVGGDSGPIWWAGNQGSGSGMDADTVDGSHASAFATAAQGARADSAIQLTTPAYTNAIAKAGTAVQSTDSTYTATVSKAGSALQSYDETDPLSLHTDGGEINGNVLMDGGSRLEFPFCDMAFRSENAGELGITTADAAHTYWLFHKETDLEWYLMGGPLQVASTLDVWGIFTNAVFTNTVALAGSAIQNNQTNAVLSGTFAGNGSNLTLSASRISQAGGALLTDIPSIPSVDGLTISRKGNVDSVAQWIPNNLLSLWHKLFLASIAPDFVDGPAYLFTDQNGIQADKSNGYTFTGNGYGSYSVVQTTNIIGGNNLCLQFPTPSEAVAVHITNPDASDSQFPEAFTMAVWARHVAQDTSDGWGYIFNYRHGDPEISIITGYPYGGYPSVTLGYSMYTSTIHWADDDTWHQTVVAMTTDYVRWYVDGQLQYSTDSFSMPAFNFAGAAKAHSLGTSMNAAYVGRGQVDGLVEWSRALSDAECVALWNGGIKPNIITNTAAPYTDAVVIYNFDEGNGTTAVDSTGHGNDGTIGADMTWQTDGSVVVTATTNATDMTLVSVPKALTFTASNSLCTLILQTTNAVLTTSQVKIGMVDPNTSTTNWAGQLTRIGQTDINNSLWAVAGTVAGSANPAAAINVTTNAPAGIIVKDVACPCN